MSENKTSIKRLYQSDKPFVPITLSEAVVVNTANLFPDSNLGITTLDKVLGHIAQDLDETVTENQLTQLVNEINNQLSSKQNLLTKDNLVGANGITVTFDQKDGKITIGSEISFNLYTIKSSLPNPSSLYSNTIVLIPSKNPSSQETDILEEYICVTEDNITYTWERLGRIQPQAEINLDNYITKDDLKTELQPILNYLDSTISAKDATTSNNAVVVVSYEIPPTLYDSVINNDYIQ